ncbi:MAG: hypothetical protein KF812_11110 [Fimbriimonadaceae bacterium]|nr:hypothetical protein [Fimbriimonadaceae bacterium]
MRVKAFTLALSMVPALVIATDHNNVDANRPLRFEDASTIAFGERTFEFGVNAMIGRRNQPVYGLGTEFKYGVGVDQEFGLGIESESADGFRNNLGHLEVRYLRQLRRDTEGAPALAIGIQFATPYGNQGGDPEFGLRGIASHYVGNYNWLHFNADVTFGNNEPRLGFLFGLSRPLGYPRDFSQTLVMEAGLEQDENRQWNAIAGIGIRQQLSPRAVIDYGVLLQGMGQSEKQSVALKFGYGVSF